MLKAKKKYRDIVEEASDLIFHTSVDGKITYANNFGEKITGYTQKELLSMNYSDFVHDSHKNSVVEFYKRQFVRKDVSSYLEYPLLKKNGETLWVGQHLNTVYGSDNWILGYRGYARDITDRVKTTQKLRESEERFRLLFNNAPAGILTVGKKGKIISVNKVVEKLLQYSKEEILGERIERFVSLNTIGKGYGNFINHYFSNLKTRKEFVNGAKVLMIQKSGINIPVEISLGYIEVENSPRCIIIIDDITDKQKAQRALRLLEEKETLLKEVHHRVKNNMQIISSLLGLQSLNISDQSIKDQLQQTENRIQSMAFVHELLYASDTFTEVNSLEYMSKLLTNLKESFVAAKDIEVDLKVGSFNIHLNQAIPCGLIVNEIISNSFKYAFKTIDRGKIRIVFEKNGEEYYLMIEDNGVGVKDIEQITKSRSLGTNLIRSLTKQLGGHLEILNENGLCYIIVFRNKTDPK